MEKALFDWPIMSQSHVCIPSINQSNHSISVHFLFFLRVFISKSYKSRSIVAHSLCTFNIVSL